MQLSLVFDATKAPPKQPAIGTDNFRVWHLLYRAALRGEYMTNREFCDVKLSNFRSRLSNLRDMGWNIPDGICLRPKVWKYWMVL